jgi:hypothetical protein
LVYRFNPDDVYTNNGVKYLMDKSGKGNDAAVYGSAIVNGTLDLKANTAAGFTTNGYAMAPNGILNNLRSYTFIARVRPASLASQPRILDFGSASSNSILLRASVLTAGFKYNGGTTTLINSSTNLTVGQEALLAMTFDAKTKTTRIYHDKVQTASATTITYEPYQLTAIGENTRNYIGRTQWWDTSVASSNIDFNGTIDDFCLLDIALTTAEMDQILNDTVTRIENLKDKNIAVFPNPVIQNESFKIDLTELSQNENLKIELLSSTGQLMKTIKPESSVIQVDAISQKGIFILRIISGSDVIRNEKLIVN